MLRSLSSQPNSSTLPAPSSHSSPRLQTISPQITTSFSNSSTDPVNNINNNDNNENPTQQSAQDQFDRENQDNNEDDLNDDYMKSCSLCLHRFPSKCLQTKVILKHIVTLRYGFDFCFLFFLLYI